MRKSFRKLYLLSTLCLVLAAVMGFPRTAAATYPEACLIEYHGCPPESYDCCCGTFQSCWLSPWECDRICSS